MTTNELDAIRRATLERVERSRSLVVKWIIATAIFEGLCLVGFFLLMDFGNRLHLLLLVMTFLIYGTLGLGMVALGAYTRFLNLRVLKAVELAAPQEPDEAD